MRLGVQGEEKRERGVQAGGGVQAPIERSLCWALVGWQLLCLGDPLAAPRGPGWHRPSEECWWCRGT